MQRRLDLLDLARFLLILPLSTSLLHFAGACDSKTRPLAWTRLESLKTEVFFSVTTVCRPITLMYSLVNGCRDADDDWLEEACVEVLPSSSLHSGRLVPQDLAGGGGGPFPATAAEVPEEGIERLGLED
ncbi:unnamed protein product [Linum trigynum]|uniref:Secreted protein n=1 Tax=Linum trigynum TaxID=586398 RepID=A0AAV2D344_9ROSI